MSKAAGPLDNMETKPRTGILDGLAAILFMLHFFVERLEALYGTVTDNVL